MDELIAQISQRARLPADKARGAAEVVISHLKGHLPAPLASLPDAFLRGGGAGSVGGLGGLGNIAARLGGMLGSR